MSKKKFDSILIIGLGLIGSSLVKAINENSLSENICGLDVNKKHLQKCIIATNAFLAPCLGAYGTP